MPPRKGFGKGRGPSKFSFTYEDYSVLSGLSIEAVRKHAQRGNFDPKDLISVLEFVQRQIQDPPQKKLVESQDYSYPRAIPRIYRKK